METLGGQPARQPIEILPSRVTRMHGAWASDGDFSGARAPHGQGQLQRVAQHLAMPQMP